MLRKKHMISYKAVRGIGGGAAGRFPIAKNGIHAMLSGRKF